MARRYSRKKAAKKEPDGKAPGEHTAPIDLDYIAARHEKEPSDMAFLVLNQGAVSKACQDTPEKFNLDCRSDSCPDRTWHTYERYVGCVLDRGDTEEDARRVWFGKKQKICQHEMSSEMTLKPPVPVARAIDCHYDACSHDGMHTLDRLISCITAAGRPVGDAIRCWNVHVGAEHRVPLDAVTLDGPDVPVPAQADPPASHEILPAPHTKSEARGCTKTKCHRASGPAGMSGNKIRGSARHGKRAKKCMSVVLYHKPVKIERLARVYSKISDIDGLMGYAGGHYNEAVNPAPLVLKVDCGYYGCIRKKMHSFTDLLECCQFDGQHSGNASVLWEHKSKEVLPYEFFLPLDTRSPLERLEATREDAPIDWSKKSNAFRDGFILRHGRDMRVLMSVQQSLKEKPVVNFPYDYDKNEQYDHRGKMAYIRVIRKGRLATTCYENGMVLVGNYHRNQYCMHQIPDGCIRHADGTRITQYRPLSCGRLTCLECLLPACNKTAGKALGRLSKMMIKLRAGVYSNSRKWIFHHFVYSLSEEHCEEFKTLAGRKRIYTMIRREIKRMGYVGGLYITHPWRFDDGLTKNNWSVHIHCVAAGFVDHAKYRVMNAKAIMSGKMSSDPFSDLTRRTGDIFIPIREFSHFSEAFDTIAYALSHAGVEETGGQAVKYFGEAAQNRLATTTFPVNMRGARENLYAHLTDRLSITKGGNDYELFEAKACAYYIQSDYMDIDLHHLPTPVRRYVTRDNFRGFLPSVYDAARLASSRQADPALAKSTQVDKGNAGANAGCACECGSRKCIIPLRKQVCDCKSGICTCFGDGSVPFVRARPVVTMNVFVVLGLRYRYKEKYADATSKNYSPVPVPTASGPPNDKKVITRTVVTHLDPSMERLCPKCRSRKITILPINGILPQPPDPEQHRIHRCYKDAGNWEMLEQKHLYKGQPYCRYRDDTLHWSNGIGVPNRHYNKQPRRVRDIQDKYILESFISYISKLACRMLRDQDEGCAVRAMRPFARKYLYETGLPDRSDQYWDYTLASHIIGLWHAGDLSNST